MELRTSARAASKSGIALLMSLSVILILSAALMKTFENRTVEVAHLENTLRRFQAETLSRSVFRALLIAIKTKGLVFVLGNRQLWQGIPFPLGNQKFFQLREITPLDSRFNLNRAFKQDDPRVRIFINIVNRIRKKKDPLAEEILEEEAHSVMSAINDWIDANQERDEAFLYDYEQYPQNELEYEVKNRAFDRLSELKLLPPFVEFGIPEEELEREFRIINSEEKIDINLASKTDVENFLGRFADIDAYPTVYDNRFKLAELISKDTDDQSKENPLELAFNDSKPRFPPPIYRRGKSDWEEKLAGENIVLNPREKRLFSPVTDYLYINFTVTDVEMTVEVESTIKVNYLNRTSTKIKSIAILDFTIH